MAGMTDLEFEALRAARPMRVFEDWLAAGRQTEKINPESLTLATVGQDGMPQARTVLLKGVSDAGLVFYTNRESRKGEALRRTAKAAMLFYWRALARQVSIEGAVRELSAAQTQPYFDSRPLGSRIGAVVSQQSRPLESLAAFRAAVADCEKQRAGAPPALPPYWRGFVLRPRRIEFWSEGEFRRHRRMVFTRADDAADDDLPGGGWSAGQLLYP